MKKIIKRGMPLIIACLILVGVPLTSYEEVKASGVEEYLYYTYWDLMTSIFAAQGYDMQVKDSVVNTHGVTGKQVWHNFTTWVKTNAKKVYDEAVALPKIVTAEGIKMSQDLWDAFKEYASYCSSSSSSYKSFSSANDLKSFLKSVIGAPVGYYGGTQFNRILSGEEELYIVVFTYNSRDIFEIFGLPSGYDFLSFNWSYYGTTLNVSSNNGSLSSYRFAPLELMYVGTSDVRSWDYTDMSWTFGDAYSDVSYKFLVKANSLVSPDDSYILVNQGACPAEVPDVSPWIKNPTIPDEWRIVQPGEVPEKDPDNNPEKVPVIIPFKPPKPQKPEKPDSTEETNPDKDKDKDKKKKPAVNPIINPQTGNVIDPETGLDIDPDTGKLIDPDTGKLIDPDDGGSGGGGGGGIADKLGKYGDITKLFPFCIPFDIVNLIKGMSAEKAPPIFHFKYYFKSINYTFKVDVDLSQYAKYIKLFRYGMQIFYILALMFMTIRISKLFS